MRIYVAHNYGRRRGLSNEECEVNVMRSIEIGRELILQGHNPFIPNLLHFVHKGWAMSPDESYWHQLSSEWLRFCDSIFVGSKPLDVNSGVKDEVDTSRVLKLPAYYSIEDVPDGTV